MRKIITVLSIIILFVSAASLSAATATMQVKTLGYGGNCKLGTWNPLIVELSDADKDINGSLIVNSSRRRETDTFSTPVNLPRNSKKVLRLYFPVPEYSRQVKVQFVAQGSVITEQQADFRPVDSSEYLVVTLGSARSTLNFLSGIGIPQKVKTPGSGPAAAPGTPMLVQVGHLEEDSLPDKPSGYDGANLLVITPDMDLSRLDKQAIDSLRFWLAGGGQMVVCGGADHERLKTPFFSEILPVEVKGSTQLISLVSLSSKYGFAVQPGGAFVCESAPKAGSSMLIKQGDTPMMVVGSYGLGSVTFIAFDPFTGPLKGWDGQQGMWKDIILTSRPAQRVIKRSLAYSALGGGPGLSEPMNSLEEASLGMSAAQPPSPASFAGFLILYLMVLVPANYYYLRKRNRFDLGWVTTPAIIIIFTFGAWGAGYVMRGGETLFTRIAVIETASNITPARLNGYFGIFASSAKKRDIEIKDPFALAAVGGNGGDPRCQFEQGEVSTLKDVEVQQWSGRSFRYHSSVDLRGPLNAELSRLADHMVVRVTNNTGMNLNDCSVCFRGTQQKIGSLRKGQTVQVSIDIDETASHSVMPITHPESMMTDQGLALCTRMAEVMHSTNEPFFVGWTEKNVLPVEMKGRNNTKGDFGILLVHLDTKGVRGL